MSNYKKISVFGGGEVYKQMKPLIEGKKIEIDKIYDDTIPGASLQNQVSEYPLLYCVGYKYMRKRYERFCELKRIGNLFVNLIADNAIISKYVDIGDGSIINQGCIIDNYVKIGECVFINIGVTISHDTVISDNVFIGPGANISGFVNVAEQVFIGTNATIINDINIGKGAVIAAGAVVTKDVEPYTLVAGCPAKIKKKIIENV